MRSSDTRPDKLTYIFLFKACSTLSAFEEGWQIHADVVKHGLDYDVYVQNTIIHFYGSCMQSIDARRVFEGLLLRTHVSWNSVVAACVEYSWFCDSIEYFTGMRNLGYELDETTMVIMLLACAELGNLRLGNRIHSQIIGKGLIVKCQLGTAVVDIYAKCGLWIIQGEKVRKRLLELEPRRGGNFVMIANKYAEVGMWDKARHVRSRMRERVKEYGRLKLYCGRWIYL